MKITKLESHQLADFRNLIEIFNDVFDNDEKIPVDDHLSRLLANPDFMAFAIRSEDRVVGGLTIYVLHRYNGVKPIAYIYDVGVAPDFQGQGLGKALIGEVCRYCKENGFEDAFVQAESDDIDAVKFYDRTRFTSKIKATVFTYGFDGEG